MATPGPGKPNTNLPAFANRETGRQGAREGLLSVHGRGLRTPDSL